MMRPDVNVKKVKEYDRYEIHIGGTEKLLAYALKEVIEEYLDAKMMFPEFNSPHEGYAMIKEQVDELWEGIRKFPHYEKQKIKKEATQVAAMTIRFMIDLFQRAK